MAVRFIPAVLSTAGTAVQLLDAIPAQGAKVVITNGSSANPIYLGTTGVTAANGAVVPPYAVVSLENVTSSAPVWAVASTVDAGGTKVGVIYGDLS